MAHELRNPLGVIKNVSYYLRMSLGKSDEKIRKHLSILDQELATSNKIITDLLDFSTGKPPVLKKTDIRPVIETAVSKARAPPNIKVELELDKDLPPLMADREQLQRVFFNLIVNAIQAMPEGGKLRIEAHREGDHAVVRVIDTGVGIKEKELSKIFEPLFTTKARGIGLGLALSRQIVEAHGGTIEASSEPGVGTTFTIKLPLK
ncbi:MAG: two-component sensor histidine kinase, partial [Methanobacteriota archaeon]